MLSEAPGRSELPHHFHRRPSFKSCAHQLPRDGAISYQRDQGRSASVGEGLADAALPACDGHQTERSRSPARERVRGFRGGYLLIGLVAEALPEHVGNAAQSVPAGSRDLSSKLTYPNSQ